MNKAILNPGNGLDFPETNDYITFNMIVFDLKGKVIQKGEQIKIRFKCDYNISNEFESAIETMCLYEKSFFKLQIDNENTSNGSNSNNNSNLQLSFEIEIISISKFP
jgi:hypothetical protein